MDFVILQLTQIDTCSIVCFKKATHCKVNKECLTKSKLTCLSSASIYDPKQMLIYVVLSRSISPSLLLKQEEELNNLVNSKLVFALKNVLLDRVKIEVEMHKQHFAIEREYHAKLAVLDAKRAAIVNGDVKPTEEECEYQYRAPDIVPVDPPADQKGIPNFWLMIMRNLELFNGMLQLRDEPILDKLVDVRYDLLLDPPVSFIYLLSIFLEGILIFL